MASDNPYKHIESRAFWKPAVGSRNNLTINELWHPKFELSQEDLVLTAGSCFAQHIGRALRQKRYNWFIAEPGPKASSQAERKRNQRFGYDVFSFRTGNIYTAALLKQWLKWAIDPSSQSTEVWHDDGAIFDPMRPAIEPDGFETMDSFLASREATLTAMRDGIRQAQVFVFTMGLTEGWENAETGDPYAMCPGTLAGEFDREKHVFCNYTHARIKQDFEDVLTLARSINPDIKFLLTVSPVPLTATASGDHVLCASMASKSTLRSVAHELRSEHEFVDYFPSYEIISSPAYRGMFFEPNMREVSPKGVEHVMEHFFEGQARWGAPKKTNRAKRERVAPPLPQSDDDLVCEEAMLEAFGE
ncbi:GSCFA domain-containing protein [Roseovarius sp.]|uniref:GSCFA domain-containing protein n=1 Tax=Roseovarius sp. TaxID=1486281 RepID=UPI003BA96087